MRDWAVALLVLLPEILIFYRKIIFSSQYIIPWDFRYYHLPLTTFIADSWRRGEFPLWDPNTYCGLPFFANINAQIFYPPTAVTIFVANFFSPEKLTYFMELHLLAHVLLAGCFTFFLLRELNVNQGAALIGATIFQCGPYFTSQTQHLGAIDGAAWIPLACLTVVHLAKRFSLRWTGILALSLALSILAGFPSTGAAALLCVFVLAAVMRPKVLLYCTAATLLAGLLSAVQLLPTLQSSRLSVSKFRGDFRGTSWGVPWQAFVSMVWPDFYHVFELDQYKLPWNPTFLFLYCGIPALALIAVAFVRKARHIAAFGTLTVVACFWMMGTHTLPGRVFFPIFFGLSHDSVYVEFTMVVFSLGIAVLAGLGAGSLRWRPHYVAVLTAIVFLDLTLAGSGKIMNATSLKEEPGITHDQYGGSRELMDWIRQRLDQSSPPSRFDTYNDFTGWVTTTPITGLPSANGNDPFALYRYMQVRLLFCKGERWGRFYMVSRPDSPILDLLNVRLLLSMTPVPENPKFVKAADLPGRSVYENRSPLPRFFLVSNVARAEDMADAVRQLGSATFDPRKTAVVEQGIAAEYPESANAAVRIVKYANAEIQLHVESPVPRYLVTSEVNYPGWRAFLDGQEKPIPMTNLAFRGLAVPAGTHEIVFRFRPAILLWSAAVSALACIVLARLLWDN
ncbi:MAG TPA: YfhO family protein [Bryobacteraceae bacterium]|nr:YfhO family protein [Bryobacteraceae bacterium]